MRDSAVISLAAGLLNLCLYVIVDPFLRKDGISRSREPTHDDKGTTRLIGILFPTCWLLLLLTSVLDETNIGLVQPSIVLAIIGGAFITGGFLVRVVAMRTLGKFFTRTLQIREEQHVVTHGIYRSVRHPGYLGDIVLFVGCGIATANVITTVAILIAFPLVFARRIAKEEQMLTESLGQEYSDYVAKSWRLIPYIF